MPLIWCYMWKPLAVDACSFTSICFFGIYTYTIWLLMAIKNFADLSPQDSTLLSDVTEVGSLPSFTREDEETRYAFYILTIHGLRYECSSVSNIQVNLGTCFRRVECYYLNFIEYCLRHPFFQVNSWLSALQSDCKSGSDSTTTPSGTWAVNS